DQTLAVWGVPTGAYLVLPFVGPFTYRGIPGAVFDVAANPITYLPLGVAALGAVNTRANAEGALQFIDEAALDPYVFTRESFLQWREYLATDGNVDLTDDVDYFDDEFDEEFDDEFDADLDDESGQLDSDSGVQLETEEIQAEKEGGNGGFKSGSEELQDNTDPDQPNKDEGLLIDQSSQIKSRSW
ncbi:MAG: VacJ family lipoprotein, partial [Methyloprofundus sp.]|nr:VacJ family lipoprotein [Methyloprofundus sp.]